MLKQLFLISCVTFSLFSSSLDTCYYNKADRVIYITMPKCGTVFLHHSLGIAYKETNLTEISEKEKKEALTFLVVRDPVTKVVSSFLQSIEKKQTPDIITSFHSYLQDLQESFTEPHQIPQSQILQMKGFSLENISFIANLDTLSADLRVFSETFDVKVHEYLGIPKNRSDGYKKALLYKHLQDHPQIKSFIEELYQEDLDFYQNCLKRREQILQDILTKTSK